MTWEPGPDPFEQMKRQALAEEGLAHLDSFRAAVEAQSEASDAADALIAAAGGVPPGGAGGTPEPDAGRPQRRELAGLILERTAELRTELRAERDGLSYGERYDLAPEQAPADFARAFTPLPVLERMVEEAEWIADLVEAVP